MRVLIIGAGPAGLTAAIHAAKYGADVMVIEHQNKTGKKLAITGNGKGNITNMNMEYDCFYGDKSFVQNVLSQFDHMDTLNYFKELGICTLNKNGYVYPLGEQASLISDRLREYAIYLGVKIKTNNTINFIKKAESCFEVDYGIKDRFDKVIIATGGKSFVNTGSNGSGYELASKLGHNIIEPKPALTALICENDVLTKASGVRINAKIDINDTYIESGQLQITDYGISGIPVFNLSHFAQEKTVITIDFLPQYTHTDARDVLYNLTQNKSLNLYNLLCGVFNDKLATTFIEKSNFKKTDVPKLDIIIQLIATIKSYKLTVKGRKGFDFAQVTAGGVDTNEINSLTMESKIIPGLYFAGEIINIDGKCGGYNLQFAWSSGYIAGRNIC